MSLAEAIKHKAAELGFDLVGITDASPIDAEHAEFLAEWLRSGCAGQMDYMRRNFEKRTNPAVLLEDAKSVICVGLNYKPPEAETEQVDVTGPAGRIANYARYEDYHTFIKKQARKLGDLMGSLVGDAVRFKVCVDSVPLVERSLAVRAGLGFVGRNHMLISPELGPEVFLGEVITNLKLQADEPLSGSCSECNKCIEACPTGALRSDGQFDANRCISYLTIEHRDEIPAGLAERIGDRLFGCDECVLACPFQEGAPACKSKGFKFYGDRARVSLDEILNASGEWFEAEFADSVIKRPGLERLKRNARICLANIARRPT